jgi:hypothetical protein
MLNGGSFRSYGFMERAENILAVTGSLRWEFLKNAAGLVYSPAAFFFGTCAGWRSTFFSSPSDCRCALSDFVRFFAMSIVCSAFVLNASAAIQRRRARSGKCRVGLQATKFSQFVPSRSTRYGTASSRKVSTPISSQYETALIDRNQSSLRLRIILAVASAYFILVN